MTTRSINSGTISFGLVSIPFKLYTAASPANVSFVQINKATGNRIKQKLVDASTGMEVPRDQIVKGYEYAREQYVTFSEADMASMDAPKSDSIEIVEFVPAESLDHVYVEKSYYVGPDKGGQKAYGLLAKTMDKLQKIAVARYVTRGREQLVTLRPYRGGLLLSYIFYANEVRNFDEIRGSVPTQYADAEISMAEKLVDRFSSAQFDVSKYKDTYTERVAAAVEVRVAGRDLPPAPPPVAPTVTDLFAALKKSLEAQI